jgi:hypothetical protein
MESSIDQIVSHDFWRKYTHPHLEIDLDVASLKNRSKIDQIQP